VAGEGRVEEPVEPFGFDQFPEARNSESRDVLRGGTLIRVFDQALLKDHRMRRVDDCEASQPRIPAKGRAPGDRSAPVVSDERERFDRQRIGERENVVDQRVGIIVGYVLRQVRPGKAPLVGHDEEELVLETRRDFAPGAVRFGEAVKQDDCGLLRVAGQRDVQRHSRAKRNQPESEALSLGRGLGEVISSPRHSTSPFRRLAAPSLSRGERKLGITHRGRRGRQWNELPVVAGDQGEAQRLPVLLRLIDAVAR